MQYHDPADETVVFDRPLHGEWETPDFQIGSDPMSFFPPPVNRPTFESGIKDYLQPPQTEYVPKDTSGVAPPEEVLEVIKHFGYEKFPNAVEGIKILGQTAIGKTVLHDVKTNMENGILDGLYIVDAINVEFVDRSKRKWDGMAQPLPGLEEGPPFEILMTTKMPPVNWAALFAHEMNHVTFPEEGEIEAYEAQFEFLRQLYRSKVADAKTRREAENALKSFPMNEFVDWDFRKKDYRFYPVECGIFVDKMYKRVKNKEVVPERPDWVKFSINGNGEIEFIF